jgi:predicted phosphodiesterase
MTTILVSLFSMTSPFSFTEAPKGILHGVYGNGDDEGDDNEGQDGEGDDDEGRGGDDDEGRGGDDGEGRGGDDGEGRGGEGDEDDDDDERDSRSFRFNDDNRNLRRLLDSLLLQERDNDDDKQEINVEPKTYEGYGLKDEDEKSNEDFNFAAAGDFGCSKNAENTVKNMEDKKPELVLPLGDLSYQSTANCWFDTMTPLKGKIMITLGHHDVNDGEEKLDQYVKGFDIDKHYYSYDYNNVHFLVMASESKFKNGSEQYNFVKQDLERTSTNKDINWIVITNYRPLYSSPSKQTAEQSMTDLYHPLFDKYGVDLVLQAHNHNYQRTYPLTYNSENGSEPIITNEFTTAYNSHKDGIVFAIVGTGGESFYRLDGQSPFIATQFDRFGFLNLEVKNGNPQTTLTGTFFDNKGDEIKDYFTIKKEIK